MAITYLSIITLNISEVISPIKRQRGTEWIKKQDPSTCYLQETHFRPKNIHRLKMKGWEKIFHENGNQKKAGVAILISDKINFKTKTVITDKEGHYIMMSIQQEDITFVNIYAPNIGAPKHIKQMLTDLKVEINSNK